MNFTNCDIPHVLILCDQFNVTISGDTSTWSEKQETTSQISEQCATCEYLCERSVQPYMEHGNSEACHDTGYIRGGGEMER